MKINNIITLSVLCIMVIAAVLYGFFSQKEQTYDAPEESFEQSSSAASDDNSSVEGIPDASESTAASSADTSSDVESTPEIEAASLSDALFIGDSRTVGIMEYAGLDDADFFCSTGMNVFGVFKERVSVPTVGKLYLNELLQNKKYGKVYIMLGINELGYNINSILSKYGELIDAVQSTQPNVKIFIQANLHVTKSRSDSDKYINNTAMNKLNSELQKLANNSDIYYIDANVLFDDANGNLSSDKTHDNVHLYAKYYAQWGEWICKETAKCIKKR